MPFSSSCVMRGSPLVQVTTVSGASSSTASGLAGRTTRPNVAVPRGPGTGLPSTQPSMTQCLVSISRVGDWRGGFRSVSSPRRFK